MKSAYNYHAQEVKKLNPQIDSLEKTGAKYSRIQRKINPLVGAGVGIALGGYTSYGINKLKAHNAHKLQTAQGHKEAVAKRNAWQSEMNKAFAGTKYASSKPRHGKKRK